MKAEDIFTTAMALLTELDSTGTPYGEYAQQYKPLAMEFIAKGASAGFLLEGIRRYVPVPAPEDEVPGDEIFLSVALPYFVGYNLVMDENPELYEKLRMEFNFLVSLYETTGTAESTPIEDIYGIEFEQGGRW